MKKILLIIVALLPVIVNAQSDISELETNILNRLNSRVLPLDTAFIAGLATKDTYFATDSLSLLSPKMNDKVKVDEIIHPFFHFTINGDDYYKVYHKASIGYVKASP